MYNCSTWVEIGKEEIRVLEGLQDYFLRMLWDTGPGAPRMALRADTGTRSMESRIWCEKIMLIFHISHLEDGDLAKDMLEEQVANNCEGYENLKGDANITNEEELVQFFTKVMERRHEMNWD